MLIDRLEGHVFRQSEIRSVSGAQLQKLSEEQGILVLQPQLQVGVYRPDELAEAVLKDEEQYVGAHAEEASAVDRFGLVRISDGHIRGLPADRSFPQLEHAIGSSFRHGRPLKLRRSSKVKQDHGPRRHAIEFRPGDLVVGGNAHRTLIEQLIRDAESRVVIHSTFISEDAFLSLLPLMSAACARGVSIDILWGQDPSSAAIQEERGRRSSRQIAADLQTRSAVRSISNRLRIHDRPTHSHAKVLLADVNTRGRYVAVVGSCNWLASGYTSVEASVVLRTPSIVAEVVACMAQLAGITTSDTLRDELVTTARSLRKRAPGGEVNGRASLVIGSDHNNYVLRARDEARRQIFMMSHRMGRLIVPGVLVPFAQACADPSLDIKVLYGKAEQDLRHAGLKEVLQSAARRRVRLQRVKDPRIHAKVLAWDTNSIVVTSQNWLSRDPPDTLLAGELGVSIDSPGASDQLMALVERQLRKTRWNVRASRRHFAR